MILPGLVSVTFRQLSPRTIVDLLVEADLKGVEWGGDLHVPHGNLVQAREVAKMTTDAGIAIVAYGSYYRFDEQELPFTQVLETALALQAPLIRVWAGKQGSAETSKAEWERIIQQSRIIADQAGEFGIKVAYEYHGGTLTDTNKSALKLLTSVNNSNFYSLWQPLCTHDQATRIAGLKEIQPWLTNLHVYYWQQGKRFSLESGIHLWQEYLSHLTDSKTTHYGLLEFVRDDQPEQFLADARSFKELLVKINHGQVP